MTIDLTQLKKLSTLFKLFSSGVHLNRLQQTELWFELEQQQAAYEQIFQALGFQLLIDSRGFAYFNTEQGTSYTNKLTQRLALVIMLLFEYQADLGLHLFQFQQWLIDSVLIESLWQKYQGLLEAEEFVAPDSIKEIFDSACRIGFVTKEENVYQLLPAVHRYLDLFAELQQAEKPQRLQESEKPQEHSL